VLIFLPVAILHVWQPHWRQFVESIKNVSHNYLRAALSANLKIPKIRGRCITDDLFQASVHYTRQSLWTDCNWQDTDSWQRPGLCWEGDWVREREEGYGGRLFVQNSGFVGRCTTRLFTQNSGFLGRCTTCLFSQNSGFLGRCTTCLFSQNSGFLGRCTTRLFSQNSSFLGRTTCLFSQNSGFLGRCTTCLFVQNSGFSLNQLLAERWKEVLVRN
jgi:hypothetical protein